MDQQASRNHHMGLMGPNDQSLYKKNDAEISVGSAFSKRIENW